MDDQTFADMAFEWVGKLPAPLRFWLEPLRPWTADAWWLDGLLGIVALAAIFVAGRMVDDLNPRYSPKVSRATYTRKHKLTRAGLESASLALMPPAVMGVARATWTIMDWLLGAVDWLLGAFAHDPTDAVSSVSAPEPGSSSSEVADPTHASDWWTLLLTFLYVVIGIVVLAIVLVAGAVVVRRVKEAREKLKEIREKRDIQFNRWDLALGRHDAVLVQYAKLETDPVQALTLPGLFATAGSEDGPVSDFLTALDAANGLRTETPPPAEYLERYVIAVNKLRTAWDAALAQARRLGTSTLSRSAAKATSRAVGLLKKARETDNDFERRACYVAARKLIDEIEAETGVKLPAKATAQIETEARLAIETAEQKVDRLDLREPSVVA